MRYAQRFKWFQLFLAAGLIVGAFPGLLLAQGQQKPTGYFAEVVDTTGTKIAVTSFSFVYSYSYYRSNCIGACGSTGTQNLYLLPMYDGCGTSMVPLTEIRSISGVQPPSRPQRPVTATVTFYDGHATTAEIGWFAGHNLDQVQGQSALGKYSLDLEKLRSITFLKERNVLPLPFQGLWRIRDGGGTLALLCKNGAEYALTSASFYGTPVDGPALGEYDPQVKVGASTTTLQIGRIKSLALKAQPVNEQRPQTTSF